MDGRIIRLGLVVAFLSMAGSVYSQRPVPTKAKARVKNAPKGLAWAKDLKTAHDLSVKTKKPVLLVFGAEWCFYCKKLEGETLRDPKLVKFINKKFIPVKLDLDKQRRVGKILEVKSLPTTVILSPDADQLGRITGFVRQEKFKASLDKALQLGTRLQQVTAQAAAPRRKRTR